MGRAALRRFGEVRVPSLGGVRQGRRRLCRRGTPVRGADRDPGAPQSELGYGIS